jgi:hypothetical protein
MIPLFCREEFKDLPDPVELKYWELFRGGNPSENDSRV